MVIEAEFEELFNSDNEGSILISEDAPAVLLDAIEEAKKALDRNTEYVIEAVGENRRAIDFGLEDPTYIQAKSATIFVGKHPEKGNKILAVGVSHSGHLTEQQIEETLKDFSSEADLSPKEVAKTVETTKALRSIRQAKYFVENNHNELVSPIQEFEDSIDDSGKEEILDKLDIVEAKLHNLLSAVYTFSETVEQSLRSIGILATHKHHIQKYEDSVAVAIGMRHYIQHKSALQVQWMVTYNHSNNEFKYETGVPITEVCESEFYDSPVYDAAGNKHDPLDYYYSEVDEYLIKLIDLSDNVEKSTNDTYMNLKSELEGEYIEGVELMKQFVRIKSFNSNGEVDRYD